MKHAFECHTLHFYLKDCGISNTSTTFLRLSLQSCMSIESGDFVQDDVIF